MLFQRINRTDPEKVFIIGKASASIIVGAPVQFSMNGTDDGLAVMQVGATGAALVVGIADAAIASGDYGLIQVYGLDDDARIVRQGVVSQSHMVIGDILDIYTASTALRGSGIAGDGFSDIMSGASALLPMFVAAATQASTDTANLITTNKIFIRCL